jgi:hypothetical protein
MRLNFEFTARLEVDQPGVAFNLVGKIVLHPTKLGEYHARYRSAFLHGGVSLGKMSLPLALPTPRGGA